MTFDGDLVDAGLVGARAVGRELGEPDEHVPDVHRRAGLQPYRAARVRGARDAGQVGRDGPAPGPQLEVGA